MDWPKANANGRVHGRQRTRSRQKAEINNRAVAKGPE